MSVKIPQKLKPAVRACSAMQPDDKAVCFDNLAKRILRKRTTERERAVAYELDERAQAYWREQRRKMRLR